MPSPNPLVSLLLLNSSGSCIRPKFQHNKKEEKVMNEPTKERENVNSGNETDYSQKDCLISFIFFTTTLSMGRRTKSLSHRSYPNGNHDRIFHQEIRPGIRQRVQFDQNAKTMGSPCRFRRKNVELSNVSEDAVETVGVIDVINNGRL